MAAWMYPVAFRFRDPIGVESMSFSQLYSWHEMVKEVQEAEKYK